MNLSQGMADLQSKRAALESAPILKVEDPVMTREELSECIGVLTAKFESLHGDVVRVERLATVRHLLWDVAVFATGVSSAFIWRAITNQ